MVKSIIYGPFPMYCIFKSKRNLYPHSNTQFQLHFTVRYKPTSPLPCLLIALFYLRSVTDQHLIFPFFSGLSISSTHQPSFPFLSFPFLSFRFLSFPFLTLKLIDLHGANVPSCSLYSTSSDRGARTMDPVVGSISPPSFKKRTRARA